MEWYHFLIIAVGILVGLGVGFGLGIGYRKKVAEREIGSAEAGYPFDQRGYPFR